MAAFLRIAWCRLRDPNPYFRLLVVPNLCLNASWFANGLKRGPRSEPFGAFSGRFSFGERQGGPRVRQIFREELFWFDHAQSPYLTKVPFVEGGYLAPAR